MTYSVSRISISQRLVIPYNTEMLKNLSKLKEAWPEVLHHMIFFLMEIDLYLIQLLSPSNRINTGRCWSSTVLRTVDIVGVTYQNSTHRMCQPIKCKTLENVNIVGVACIRPPRRMCWSIECKTLKTVVIKWKFNCWFHVWIDYIY